MSGSMNSKDTNMDKDFNQYIDDLLSDIDLPSEAELAEETKAAKISLRLKGIKHSEQTKKKWSEAHIGKKMDIHHANKLHQGRKNNAFERLIERVSKEDILKAIQLNGNHQSNTINYLGISIHTFKKLCNHYNITPLKKSPKETGDFSVKNQSEPVKVWVATENGIGEFYNEFYSVSECCRVMGLHKGNMLRNMKNGTPYKGYFFKKENPPL